MAMVIMVMVVKSWNVKCSSFHFSDDYGDYGDGARSKHKETWCSLVFHVFHVFHVFRVFRVFPSSEPPKTIKRSTAVYNAQPTAIGVLYNYNMTTQ